MTTAKNRRGPKVPQRVYVAIGEVGHTLTDTSKCRLIKRCRDWLAGDYTIHTYQLVTPKRKARS